MPTQLSINDAATWRNPAYIAVNDVGTWRQIAQVWVRNVGTWEIVTPYYTAITIGFCGGTEYGYSSGAISPPTTGGGTLHFNPGGGGLAQYGIPNMSNPIAFWSGPGDGAIDRDFWFTCGQSVSNQFAFSEILVEDAAGSVRRYTTLSAASYGYSGGFNVGIWGWGIGASHVYTPASVGQRRWICIMP